MWALGVKVVRAISYLLCSVFIFILMGCSTACVEKYVPKRIDVDSEIEVEVTSWNELIYKKGEYEFFPRFYTLTKSYSEPGAILIVSSSTNNSVYLQSVVLESHDKKHRDVVKFSQETPLERRNEEKNLNYAALPVFGIENTELSKYWESGDIRVIVNYLVNGKAESLIFEFELRKNREIVWPT